MSASTYQLSAFIYKLQGCRVPTIPLARTTQAALLYKLRSFALYKLFGSREELGGATELRQREVGSDVFEDDLHGHSKF